jgi:hypothetical protein
MGPRGLSVVVAMWVASSGRAVLAEDIGHEPLAPAPSGSPVAPPGSAVAPPASAPAAPPGSLVAQPASAPAAPGARSPAPVASTPPPSSKEGATHRSWYGWETLLVDGVWVVGGIVLLSSRNPSGAISTPLVADYFLGPPIVHAAHGHADRAFASLGLRLAGPLLLVAGVGSFWGSGSSSRDSGLGAGLMVLGVLAIPAAVAIDAAVIAREDVTPEESAAVRSRMGFSPWVDPLRRAGGLSVTLGM